MTDGEKKKILIIEDAEGTANAYKMILERSDYDATICPSEKIQSLIDEDKKFDGAIVDVVLPSEDPKKFKLEQCNETGMRLMKIMIENDICHRFYVITVRSTLRSCVEQLCEEKKAILKFEAKIDHEPEKLVDNVAHLLAIGIPEQNPEDG